MVKCVVSGCPNRVSSVNDNRGIFNRPPKRFFNFPTDPARIKVWLAALREADKEDSGEQRLICEDHFLPEDISTSGVSSDAIPIMPPCLDGPLGMIGAWGDESSEEEEDDQWAGGGGEEDDTVDVGGDDGPAKVEPPVPGPSAVDRRQQGPGDVKTSETKTTGSPHQSAGTTQANNNATRPDATVAELTHRFLELMLAAPDSSLDVRQMTMGLQTGKRRIYDITSVLESISLIEKQSVHRFKWIGRCQISSFLQKNLQKSRAELQNLKLVEDTLDGLIKSCAQQLFDMTDDKENAALAYVTQQDVSRLGAFQDQTVIVVKAPEETKLEVPAPKEDSIQVHLKGGKGPITVMTCDIVTGEKSSCFFTLEESRIRTSALHSATS